MSPGVAIALPAETMEHRGQARLGHVPPRIGNVVKRACFVTLPDVDDAFEKRRPLQRLLQKIEIEEDIDAAVTRDLQLLESIEQCLYDAIS